MIISPIMIPMAREIRCMIAKLRLLTCSIKSSAVYQHPLVLLFLRITERGGEKKSPSERNELHPVRAGRRGTKQGSKDASYQTIIAVGNCMTRPFREKICPFGSPSETFAALPTDAFWVTRFSPLFLRKARNVCAITTKYCGEKLAIPGRSREVVRHIQRTFHPHVFTVAFVTSTKTKSPVPCGGELARISFKLKV